jgi:hypothetical protein
MNGREKNRWQARLAEASCQFKLFTNGGLIVVHASRKTSGLKTPKGKKTLISLLSGISANIVIIDYRQKLYPNGSTGNIER